MSFNAPPSSSQPRPAAGYWPARSRSPNPRLAANTGNYYGEPQTHAPQHEHEQKPQHQPHHHDHPQGDGSTPGADAAPPRSPPRTKRVAPMHPSALGDAQSPTAAAHGPGAAPAAPYTPESTRGPGPESLHAANYFSGDPHQQRTPGRSPQLSPRVQQRDVPAGEPVARVSPARTKRIPQQAHGGATADPRPYQPARARSPAPSPTANVGYFTPHEQAPAPQNPSAPVAPPLLATTPSAVEAVVSPTAEESAFVSADPHVVDAEGEPALLGATTGPTEDRGRVPRTKLLVPPPPASRGGNVWASPINRARGAVAPANKAVPPAAAKPRTAPGGGNEALIEITAASPARTVDSGTTAVIHDDLHTHKIISPWEQACLRHIFPNAFNPNFSIFEVIAVATLVISVFINLFMSALNIAQDSTDSELEIVRAISKVVFFFEFSIMYLFFVLLVIVILYGVFSNQTGTDYLIDIIDVSQMIANFSVLQVVGYSSGARGVRRVTPYFLRRASWRDPATGCLLIFIWGVAFVIAAATVVLKVTQVDFVGDVSITDWGFNEYVKLIGLVNNLGSIDASYRNETRLLLKAVHAHFIGPGGPDSVNPRTEGFFSKLLSCLRIQRDGSYEFFESAFRFAIGDEDELGVETPQAKSRTSREGAIQAFNFSAFVLMLDVDCLKQFLQMVHSPIGHYATARARYNERLLAGSGEDELNEIVKGASAVDERTLEYGLERPAAFRVTYSCTNGHTELFRTLDPMSNTIMVADSEL